MANPSNQVTGYPDDAKSLVDFSIEVYLDSSSDLDGPAEDMLAEDVSDSIENLNEEIGKRLAELHPALRFRLI